MRESGIPINLKDYDAETCCPLVEQYWQKFYPNTFKIFIFNEYGDYRPIYQSDVTEYKHEIVLYHHGDHFEGVRTMCRFFNKSQYYCFSCLAPYCQPKQHEARCKARCINCTRMGVNFPCPKDENYFRECNKCQKEFKNEDCYKAHLERKLCDTFKKCKKCGHIYDLKLLKKIGLKKHYCLYKFCRQCFTTHKGPCYMQPMVLKKPQPYRLCFFDFETQQKKIIYDRNGKGKYLHEPVFVGAYITCSECIENGKWRSSLAGNNSSCRICGNFRSIAFAPFEFQETKVDYKEKTDNPLNSFVDFLLNKTDPKFKNICFAHNGGRFDSIMV